MKIRIIGIIVVLAILGGLYLATEGTGTSTQSSPSTSSPSQDDSALKNLKI